MPSFHVRSTMPVSADELYDWHSRPGAFERLAPPWQHMSIEEQRGGIEQGAVLRFRIHQGPLSIRWEAYHDRHEPGRSFRDVQARGPFARWLHTHRFEPIDADHSALDDHVEYQPPLHAVTGPMFSALFTPQLERMFAFRHRRTMQDLTRHTRYADRPSLRVAITGGSGMIGRALTAFLRTGGHEVLIITRSPEGEDQIGWDPREDRIDASRLEGVDAVINLAGEPVSQRWSEETKERILESRRQSTALIARTISALEDPPSVLVSASAVGYYGHERGDQICTEQTPPGDDFLARVCLEWEAASDPAREAGIRVVHPRIGIVLSPQGGALEALLTPFKMGLGGRVGSGKQWMSWIALDDAVGALHYLMMERDMEGPVNLSAPHPVTNAQFTKSLGRALGRPTFLPTPTFAIKAALGSEAAETMLLGGQRALPRVLDERDFEFFYPKLQGALDHLLGAKAA